MAINQLYIGFEFEFFFVLHDERFHQEHPSNQDTSKTVGKILQLRYNAEDSQDYASMRWGFDIMANSMDRDIYSKWTVKDEPELHPKDDQLSLRWPLETTSPVCPYIGNEGWRKEADRHFKIVRTVGNINITEQCGMHVHLSPGTPTNIWALEQAKIIACASLWFEQAFEVILPVSRRANKWAMSNSVDNWWLCSLGMNDRFERIMHCSTFDHLSFVMNPQDLKWGDRPDPAQTAPGNFPRSPLPRQELPPLDRFYGWKFMNLSKESKRKNTIEFRRCPAVDSSLVAQAWVDFVALFVLAAADCNLNELKGYSQDVGGLKGFTYGMAQKVQVRGNDISRAKIGLDAVFNKHKNDSMLEPVEWISFDSKKRFGLEGVSDAKKLESMTAKLKGYSQ